MSTVRSPGSAAAPATTARFAVVMPAFDAEATIAEAIASVAAQTWTDWELAVADDGSRDGTRAVAERFAAADGRIRVVAAAHCGVAAACGLAVAATSAPYLLRFDADDALLPDCMATYAAFIAGHPGYDIYSCDAEVFDESGPLGRYYAQPAFLGVTRGDAPLEFTLEGMLERCLIASPASVCRRAAYERAGGMRSGVVAEDYDLWLRMMARGARHLYLPAALVRYRRHPGQVTASPGRLLESGAESLEHLTRSGVLEPRLRAAALASARRQRETARRDRAVHDRAALEARLRAGDLRGARSGFLRARAAYDSRLKFAAAIPVALLSPRLYAAFLRRRGR